MRSIFCKGAEKEESNATKRAQEKRKGFTKKISNTTYDVSFHYGRQSRESMNDKMIRLIKNDMQGIKNEPNMCIVRTLKTLDFLAFLASFIMSLTNHSERNGISRMWLNISMSS